MTTVRTHPRPRTVLLLLITATLALVGLGAPTAASAAPFCGITWGSLDKSSTAGGTGFLDNVRAGRHACYDRLVIDFTDSWQAGYNGQVNYVDEVIADASGQVVPMRGGAYLQIRLEAATFTPEGTFPYAPADSRELVNVAGYRTFRQVALSGFFEGVVHIAVGVRARLPFRVFTLSGPNPTQTRLVIDVAHAWQQ